MATKMQRNVNAAEAIEAYYEKDSDRQTVKYSSLIRGKKENRSESIKLSDREELQRLTEEETQSQGGLEEMLEAKSQTDSQNSKSKFYQLCMKI